MSDENFVQPMRPGLADREAMSARYAHIKGWGIDIDPKNDPVYPMRQRPDPDHPGGQADRPEAQPDSVEILKSNERPDRSRVFGTSVPPSGLSGVIRRCAFRYSESRYRHWLLLTLADRVNMVEGLADDVCQGKIPNCLKERGFSAELRHNRKAVVGRAVTGTLVLTALVLCLRRKR